MDGHMMVKKALCRRRDYAELAVKLLVAAGWVAGRSA
jgi:hypothetical protein